MKAILIDPVQRSISEIDYDDTDFHNIGRSIHAELFTVVQLVAEGDGVYVDDEGRINGNGERVGGFRLLGEPDRSLHFDLAGYGLVLGSDDEGASQSPKTTMAWLRDHLEWLDADWFKANPPPPMEFHAMDDDEFYRHLLGPSA